MRGSYTELSLRVNNREHSMKSFESARSIVPLLRIVIPLTLNTLPAQEEIKKGRNLKDAERQRLRTGSLGCVPTTPPPRMQQSSKGKFQETQSNIPTDQVALQLTYVYLYIHFLLALQFSYLISRSTNSVRESTRKCQEHPKLEQPFLDPRCVSVASRCLLCHGSPFSPYLEKSFCNDRIDVCLTISNKSPYFFMDLLAMRLKFQCFR